MPDPIILKPHKTDTVEDLPLGFQAGIDIAAGNIYADTTGNLVSRAQLDAQLRGKPGAKRMVRITLRYWMPGDSKEAEPRRTVVSVPVVGAIDSEALGRIVHDATRKVHNTIRAKGGHVRRGKK